VPRWAIRWQHRLSLSSHFVAMGRNGVIDDAKMISASTCIVTVQSLQLASARLALLSPPILTYSSLPHLSSPPHTAFPSFHTPILAPHLPSFIAPRAVTPSPLRGLTRLLHVTLPAVLTTCAYPCARPFPTPMHHASLSRGP
jgi:hypothetical protein